MNLEEYIGNLQKIIDAYPEMAKCMVVSASDDEGNSFQPIHYTPTIGQYHTDDGGVFTSKTNHENGDEIDETLGYNAVCVN